MARLTVTIADGVATFAVGPETLALRLADYRSGAEMLEAAREWHRGLGDGVSGIRLQPGQFLGRISEGEGPPEVLTLAQVRAAIGLAALRDRATHTGTQTAATISDFASAVRAVIAAPP